ncbi:MAG: regulatory protein RecX [Oscillospiraceae bacterium]
MKILEVNRKKTYYEIVTEFAVYELDGEFVRTYHIDSGSEMEKEILRELHDKSRFRRAYRRACYLLDAREYSYALMYRKLMQTYDDKALCEKVMGQLVQCGAINDKRYAQKLAEYLIECKHYGIFRVRQEMLRRGLEKHLIEEILSKLEDSANDYILEVLTKKYGKILIDPEDYQVKQKVIAGMSRLGYPLENIKNAIEDYFYQLENEE